ncbi:D-amino acid oxidase [Nadsonia fulvescens var. elongata DSM 6958]|uniref:D-amino acid oxidase n=1 Tax=Nadsonia fulvescens var. elongata DSM 6958 TaxID=857566 RepID=A0A1E3PG34_9ASCO|nr:D-amino acid oxidase [Nadsonia fulvescens var. elongata DSM 6958]
MGNKTVIVGAGIIGMYTALQLAGRGEAKNITIIGEYLPGDSSIKYTSPWAGGNFSAISGNDDDTLEFDKVSFFHLRGLFDRFGLEAGLKMLPSTEYWDFLPEKKKIDSLMSYIPDLCIIPKSDLIPGTVFGVKYTTYNFNCPRFLEFLYRHLQSQGVTFLRKKLAHISEAWISPCTKTVYNCSGIGARHLPGIEDQKVYPTRGQIAIVRAPEVQENRMRWGIDYATYIIPRPNSNGNVVLGGFLQKGNWSSDTYSYEREDIFERTAALMPELKTKIKEVLREAAGLRPSREGGVRIEREDLSDGRVIIHNYGASGTGYQSGFGMSMRAINLATNQSKL